MRNIVIDTNILISALITPNGKPAQIIELIDNIDIKVVCNEKILDEYREVLSRPKFDFSIDEQKSIVEDISSFATHHNPTASNIPLPDEKDRIFYDTAKSSGAILITGNMKHYPEESFIMTPAGFINLFKP